MKLKGSEWNETLFLLIQVIYQEVVAPKVNIEDLVDLCFEEEFKKKVITLSFYMHSATQK